MKENAPAQSEGGFETQTAEAIREHSEALRMQSAESRETRHTLKLLAAAVIGLIAGSELQKGSTQKGDVAALRTQLENFIQKQDEEQLRAGGRINPDEESNYDGHLLKPRADAPDVYGGDYGYTNPDGSKYGDYRYSDPKYGNPDKGAYGDYQYGTPGEKPLSARENQKSEEVPRVPGPNEA